MHCRPPPTELANLEFSPPANLNEDKMTECCSWERDHVWAQQQSAQPCSQSAEAMSPVLHRAVFAVHLAQHSVMGFYIKYYVILFALPFQFFLHLGTSQDGQRDQQQEVWRAAGRQVRAKIIFS